MRVLHLTPELPFAPGAGGGRAREFFLCRRLVELDHQVLNISPVLPDEVRWAASLQDVGVENWLVPRPGSRVREVLVATRTEPRVLGAVLKVPVRALEMLVFETSMRPFIERAVRDWRPDVVVVGHDMAAAWALSIPREIPAVLTLHNLTWRWYLSRSRLRHGLRAALLRAEAARYQNYVLGLLPRFSAAVCVSTVEAEELRAATPIPVSVIPCGVDTQAHRPVSDDQQAPVVLFTGTLSYAPNSQGIRWFVEHVWPRVVAAIPEARLEVVGRNPSVAVTALARHHGVDVVGPVPAMEPHFAKAQVVVVPILTGAGIRVKIIEAMSAGRAIVSTSLGFEGLPEVRPDQHLLAADRPEDFADAIVRLLHDPALRRRISEAARTLAERRYDWRQLSDEQVRVIETAYEQGKH